MNLRAGEMRVALEDIALNGHGWARSRARQALCEDDQLKRLPRTSGEDPVAFRLAFRELCATVRGILSEKKPRHPLDLYPEGAAEISVHDEWTRIATAFGVQAFPSPFQSDWLATAGDGRAGTYDKCRDEAYEWWTALVLLYHGVEGKRQ